MSPRDKSPSLRIPGLRRLRAVTSRGGITVYEGHKTAQIHPSDDRSAQVRIHVFEGKAAHRLDQAKLIPEIRSATGVTTPAVARILTSGMVPDATGEPPPFYVVTEWMEGQTIEAYMADHANQPVPPMEATRLVAAIARALSLIEQDKSIAWLSGHVRPSSVWIQDLDHVRIDNPWLETALLTCAAPNRKQLSTSLAYMAPEQVSGRSVDIRTDLFSCAVLYHELLTGKRLFDATSRSGVVSQIKKAPILPPSQTCPWIDSKVDQLVTWALDRNPDKRPDSATKWEQALRGHVATAKDAGSKRAQTKDARARNVVVGHARNAMNEKPTATNGFGPSASSEGSPRGPTPYEQDTRHQTPGDERPHKTAPDQGLPELSATVPSDSHPDLVTAVTRSVSATSVPPNDRSAVDQDEAVVSQTSNHRVLSWAERTGTSNPIARLSRRLTAWIPEIVMVVGLSVLLPLAIFVVQAHSVPHREKHAKRCTAVNGAQNAPSKNDASRPDWILRSIRPLPRHTAPSSSKAARGMVLILETNQYDPNAVANLRILAAHGPCIRPTYWIPAAKSQARPIIQVVFPTEPAPGMVLCTPDGPRPLSKWTPPPPGASAVP